MATKALKYMLLSKVNWVVGQRIVILGLRKFLSLSVEVFVPMVYCIFTTVCFVVCSEVLGSEQCSVDVQCSRVPSPGDAEPA